jgi:hypothetical protein
LLGNVAKWWMAKVVRQCCRFGGLRIYTPQSVCDFRLLSDQLLR